MVFTQDAAFPGEDVLLQLAGRAQLTEITQHDGQVAGGVQRFWTVLAEGAGSPF